LDPELLELALDAPIAPARVLTGQLQDQRNHIASEPRAPTSTVGLRPFAGHQPPVPPQDRVRGHEKDRPAPARERATQQRQQRTIGGLELGALDLAAQHLELVAQHRDLDVFGVLAAEAANQHAHESACHEVEEGQGHRRIILPRSLLLNAAG